MNRTKRTMSRVAGLALVLTGAAPSWRRSGQRERPCGRHLLHRSDRRDLDGLRHLQHHRGPGGPSGPGHARLRQRHADRAQPQRHGHPAPDLRPGPELGLADVVGRPPGLPEHGHAEPRPAGRVRDDDHRGAAVERGPRRPRPRPPGRPPRCRYRPQFAGHARSERAELPQALPETGRPTVPLLALGAGAVLGGLGLVAAARRRPEQA